MQLAVTTLMVVVEALRRSQSVTSLVVHAVWATAGRVRALDREADRWLADELNRRSLLLGAALLAVGHADDHVHVLVQHPPDLSVSELMKQLKGASSRAAHRRGVRHAALGWQPGYWAESVDGKQLGPLLHYVRNQRDHHQGIAVDEPWLALVR